MTGPNERRAGGRAVPAVQAVLAGHRGDAATARDGLADPDPGVRSAALGALARCGALTPGDLVAALGDDDPVVRRRAAEEAARSGSPDVADALIRALDDPDELVVEAAAHALGELEPAPAAAVGPLAAIATGHAEVVVRETAVAALGSLGDPGGLPAVLAAATDVATVRRRAVLALAAFDGPEVDAALARLAGDRDRQTRQAAEDLLQGWGSP